MASSQRKKVVYESEKSQKVQMLNWIQDALYSKSQKSLSKCEKSVVGKITVDQKLLFKRYNQKLHQSKLTFARITDNHELEKELVNNVTFNTDVGREGEKNIMLQRIWNAGSNKFENLRRLRSNRYNNKYSSQFKLRIRSLKEDDDREENLEEACISHPVIPATKQRSFQLSAKQRTPSVRPKSCVTFRTNTKGIHFDDNNFNNNVHAKFENVKRVTINDVEREIPITSFGHNNETDVNDIENTAGELQEDNIDEWKEINGEKLDTEHDLTLNTNDSNEEKCHEEEQNASCPVRGTNENLDANITADDMSCLPPRPHTVMGDSKLDTRSLGQNNGRRQKSAPTKSVYNNRSFASFFNPDKKPTLLDMHKQKLQEANFENRIENFSCALRDFVDQNECANSVDYYSQRFKTVTEREEKRKLANLMCVYQNLVNTTEGERNRWKGNPNIRSMTTRSLDLDFQNRPTTFIHPDI